MYMHPLRCSFFLSVRTAIAKGDAEFPGTRTILNANRAAAAAELQNAADWQLPRSESVGVRLCCSLLWILLLLYVAWPVASFCVSLWIFLQVCMKRLSLSALVFCLFAKHCIFYFHFGA